MSRPVGSTSPLVDMWRDRSLIGRTVVRNGETAVVESLLSGDAYEGGVCLDRQIEGFRFWNIDDLTIITESQP